MKGKIIFYVPMDGFSESTSGLTRVECASTDGTEIRGVKHCDVKRPQRTLMSDCADGIEFFAISDTNPSTNIFSVNCVQ